MSNYYKQEDLDSALSEFLVSPYANDDTQFSCGAKDALKLLRDIVNENVPDCLKIPAADVVELVRCKDCKFWGIERGYKDTDPPKLNHQPDGTVFAECIHAPVEIGDSMCTDGEFYCAFGERRTGNG